jgi:hypothetical protein
MADPKVVALGRELRRKPRGRRRPSLRAISATLAERGYVNVNSRRYVAKSIARSIGTARWSTGDVLSSQFSGARERADA